MCDCSGKGSWGGRVGDQLQQRAMKSIKSWTGLGDYTVHQNSLITPGSAPFGVGQGLITRPPKHGTVLTRAEFIGDIKTHPTHVGMFHVQKFRINPASKTTFPWLSNLAVNWDKWRANGIIFEFQTCTSAYATNTGLGNIYTACDYDVLDNMYTDKAEMVNSAYATQSILNNNVWAGIECAPETLQNRVFYTLPDGAPMPAGDSARSYDLGNFMVATSDSPLPPGTTVGSLWVHYEFYMMEEQVPRGVGGKQEQAYFRKDMSGLSAPLGNSWIKWGDAENMNSAATIAMIDAGIAFYPACRGKKYMVTFTMQGADDWGNVPSSLAKGMCCYSLAAVPGPPTFHTSLCTLEQLDTAYPRGGVVDVENPQWQQVSGWSLTLILQMDGAWPEGDIATAQLNSQFYPWSYFGPAAAIPPGTIFSCRAVELDSSWY